MDSFAGELGPRGRPAGLRERLRQETGALHARLDAALEFPERADLAWYERLLRANAPVIALEFALTAAGIERYLPDWPHRERAHALAHDLRALGLSVAAPELAPLAADAASLLGWTYVLEGSRLGGQVILRFVEATGSPLMLEATRFLRHGQDERLWVSFVAVLNGLVGDDAAVQRACDAAQAGFRFFLGNVQEKPASQIRAWRNA